MTAPAVALPLRGLVVYPGMIRSIPVGRPSSVASAERHLEEGRTLVLVPQRDADEEDPERARMATVGTLATALRSTRLPDGSLRLLVQGVQRVRVGPLASRDGLVVVEVLGEVETDDDPIAVGARARVVAGMFAEWTRNQGLPPPDHGVFAADPDDPERVADQVAGQVPMSLEDRLAVLEEPSVLARLARVADRLAVTLASQRIDQEMGAKVQAAMDSGQREYHLREQLKVIRAELGDAYGTEAEADLFETKIRAAVMPDDVRAEALREVDRLRRIQSDSGEYTVSRTWLETVREEGRGN